MKKVLKYFIITLVFTCGLIANVKAEVTKADIDFKEDKIVFDQDKAEFTVASGNTITYQWIKIADSGSALIDEYNDYINALVAYENDATTDKTVTNGLLETEITELYTALTNSNSLPSETNWVESAKYSGTLTSGDKFVVWAKAVDTTANTTKYGFGIYTVAETTTVGKTDVTNPETGINTLYIVPLLIIAGSVLVFKKRRYE